MDKIRAFSLHSPAELTTAIGQRLKRLRLARGWNRQQLAEQSGVSLSTLKLLETKGKGSLQRLARVAVVLGVEGELHELFSRSLGAESIEAVKKGERGRAPRRSS